MLLLSCVLEVQALARVVPGRRRRMARLGWPKTTAQPEWVAESGQLFPLPLLQARRTCFAGQLASRQRSRRSAWGSMPWSWQPARSETKVAFVLPPSSLSTRSRYWYRADHLESATRPSTRWPYAVHFGAEGCTRAVRRPRSPRGAGARALDQAHASAGRARVDDEPLPGLAVGGRICEVREDVPIRGAVRDAHPLARVDGIAVVTELHPGAAASLFMRLARLYAPARGHVARGHSRRAVVPTSGPAVPNQPGGMSIREAPIRGTVLPLGF